MRTCPVGGSYGWFGYNPPLSPSDVKGWMGFPSSSGTGVRDSPEHVNRGWT